jgi:hypothetical protein
MADGLSPDIAPVREAVLMGCSALVMMILPEHA